jgi:hypothetical protein
LRLFWTNKERLFKSKNKASNLSVASFFDLGIRKARDEKSVHEQTWLQAVFQLTFT